jgi:hypothetical protein
MLHALRATTEGSKQTVTNRGHRGGGKWLPGRLNSY